MGYNTTVFILNDGFGELQRYPEQAIDRIFMAMHDGGDCGVGNHANVLTVMPTRHADEFRLYASHHNLMIELSPYSKDTRELFERRPDIVHDYIQKARNFLEFLEESINTGDDADA